MKGGVDDGVCSRKLGEGQREGVAAMDSSRLGMNSSDRESDAQPARETVTYRTPSTT